MRPPPEATDGRATLLRGASPVARLEIATTSRSRHKGLLGRDGVEGVLLITRTLMVHTLGMRFPIDVAYLTKDLRVLEVVSMPPNRAGMWRPRARHVLEAELGSLAQGGFTQTFSWGSSE